MSRHNCLWKGLLGNLEADISRSLPVVTRGKRRRLQNAPTRGRTADKAVDLLTCGPVDTADASLASAIPAASGPSCLVRVTG